GGGGLRGGAPWRAARGAAAAVGRGGRRPPPRHCARDTRVLARGRAERTRPPVCLLKRDACPGGGLLASAPQTLGPVAPVVVEVCGVLLGGDPIDAGGARRARGAGGRPPQGRVAPVRQRPQDASGSAGRWCGPLWAWRGGRRG